MPNNGTAPSREILEAALHGLELQKQRLDEQIMQVRSLLGRRVGRPPKGGLSVALTAAAPAGRRKRTLSEEARRRISAAQKKRWASFRKGQ